MEQFLATLGAELPGLTVHDITHLDALWRVADEIAGPDYPLNAAEAYVFGGALLLHDAAHVLFAYPGGMAEIKQTTQWKDLVAQQFAGEEIDSDTDKFKYIVFQALRHIHARQAQKLASMSWSAPGAATSMFLIESHELRAYYGDVIGQVAASHHWSTQLVQSTFRSRKLSCPAFLGAADWEVDALKLALLLRVADAAHLDDSRAPWFLFALRKPAGVSLDHWHFQARMGQPKRTEAGELRLSSGASFGANERNAWWLAFDTAKMVDAELRASHAVLREEARPPFAATKVQGADSAESFLTCVPVQGWVPVDVAPKISNVPHLVSTLGGKALYGDRPAVALRELLQNAIDAVTALRHLGGLGPDEGEVRVRLRRLDSMQWSMEVQDTGVGMSRYVMTNVLIDFGSSLWRSDAVRDEFPGLAASGFKSIGRFGIGFFSVFMLGGDVCVTTRRFERSVDDAFVGWQLVFDDGLESRPALVPLSSGQALARPGTCVTVRLSEAVLVSLLSEDRTLRDAFLSDNATIDPASADWRGLLEGLIGRLAPASSVRIAAQFGSDDSVVVVGARDWSDIRSSDLCKRLGCPDATLIPLVETNGELLGRLALKPRASEKSGTITFQGVSCGRTRGLIGLAKASSNSAEATRGASTPSGSLHAWRCWAEAVSAAGLLRSIDNRLRVHPLIPEQDLAIWVMRERQMTLRELIDELCNESRFLMHVGAIDHEDSDDVGSDMFDRDFSALECLVICPRMRPSSSLAWGFDLENDTDSFPWVTGAVEIDYQAEIERRLFDVWGEYEKLEEYCPIGDVNEAEIMRHVVLYERTNQTANAPPLARGSETAWRARRRFHRR
jgi:hypothetical protein